MGLTAEIAQKVPDFIIRNNKLRRLPTLPLDFQFSETQILLDGLPFLIANKEKVLHEIELPAGIKVLTIEVLLDEEVAIQIAEGELLLNRLHPDYPFDALSAIRKHGLIAD
jgi:hypothetical protein